jgi:3-hydroxy-9,10-secoandrosta-1,3,5(10)-triene-9,17-dione monooxygenase reductase component
MLEPDRYRQVLGQFCTGVTVVATCDERGPAGFACQSFAAVSLDPPLVLFCPSRSSATWPRIAMTGHFCASVLADEQRELARIFGASGEDKFAGVRWSPASSGSPVLDGALTWVGAAVEAVHEAGDHYVVLGRVTELGACRSTPCSPGRGTPTGSDCPSSAAPGTRHRHGPEASQCARDEARSPLPRRPVPGPNGHPPRRQA